MENFVFCGYLVEDENKEKFSSFVKELDNQIKDMSFFEELGFQFYQNEIHVISGEGEEKNGIDECCTFVGKRIFFSEEINEIKQKLARFEKFLNDDEKSLKIIISSVEVEDVFYGYESEGVSLNNDSTVYTTVEKIIKSVCDDYDILKAKTSLDDNGIGHYVFEISGGKNGNGNWFNYFSDINQIFSILNYEFKKVWLIKIDNDVLDDVHYITFGISSDSI